MCYYFQLFLSRIDIKHWKKRANQITFSISLTQLMGINNVQNAYQIEVGKTWVRDLNQQQMLKLNTDPIITSHCKNWENILAATVAVACLSSLWVACLSFLWILTYSVIQEEALGSQSLIKSSASSGWYHSSQYALRNWTGRPCLCWYKIKTVQGWDNQIY